MTTAELALVISIISIIVSIWSAFATRRAMQFKRLGELRTKSTNLRWEMHYRLEDVKEAAKKAGLLDIDAKGNWGKDIARLESILIKVREQEKAFASVYTIRKWVPLILPESTIEEWHHKVDNIATSVDVSRRELVPKFKKSAEELAQLLEQQKQHVAELENVNQAMLGN
jgi:hypothetical protein